MNFGLFEPLFGKQIPKQHNFSPKEPEQPSVPASKVFKTPKVNKKVEKLGPDIIDVIGCNPFPINNTQLGELFGELDQSKVIILVLAVAVAIMFVFFFYLNTRQKSQKHLIYKMEKQLKRLRG